jgi:hypothetical protein
MMIGALMVVFGSAGGPSAMWFQGAPVSRIALKGDAASR